MKRSQDIYRKNFSLIIAFLILISVVFVVALFISYEINARYVESEFESKKVDVWEQTIKPYNDLVQYKIPEITSYQGFLDSTSAAKYADSVLRKYPFVRKIIFYDASISSHPNSTVFINNLGININAMYQFLPAKNGVSGLRIWNTNNEDDFKQMAVKLSDYIAFTDTSKTPGQTEVFNTFYDISSQKISYSNIFRREDLKTYHDLSQHSNPTSYYKQSILTFFLDPRFLKVRNTHKELYQSVSVQPYVYDPLDAGGDNIVTEAGLTGAFAAFKLYFISPHNFLNSEANRRFMPIAGMILLIYFFLMLIGWLIYRNLNVNIKLFKLQYDFINNFTHEFKTPVSVIKIAGSNLSADSGLSERQRKQYGRILNEEADKLNELMNKLLSFTQLENKSIAIKKEQINVDAFLSRYKETFKIKYPDFKIHCHVDGKLTFNADPVLLGSVFQNLVENAYKYSHPDKRELNINVYKEKRELVFSFADKGIGIPKSELNNIFKKFYRIENKYNQNGSVGLGLAFCKELVNFMNGDITVNSKLNEGSEFKVVLPYEN